MNITVFSDTAKVKNIFTSFNKSKEISISTQPVNDLKKIINKSTKNSVVYIDISNHSDSDINKTIQYLSNIKGHHFGIIDPKGKIKDPALLFHSFAFDYIGKEINSQELTLKRLKRALDYLFIIAPELEDIYNKDSSQPNFALNLIPSDDNWKKIKTGIEYTFCFMFVEFDGKRKLNDNFNSNKLQKFIQDFYRFIHNIVKPINGNIWMWTDFGGVILFPFNGKKCEAILACFELFLKKDILNFEEFDYNILLSFRVALHVGNTVYKPFGSTGKIVSDSINSVFHLGEKYAPPGSFLLTESLFGFIPEGLKDYFIPYGDYEGRKIMKMAEIL